MTDLGTAARVDAAAGDVRAVELSIRLANTEAEAREAVRVLGDVWPRQDAAVPLPPELAWVFAHSGNYVALAYDGERAIGAAIGFRGQDAEGSHLHSHIAGVLPEWQGSSVGYALKQHQRMWSLERGLHRVTWTFDPLVARNAYFNVVKLGARLTRYYVDFYGPMDDGINLGDETDRCLVTWRLDNADAVATAAGRFVPADTEAQRAAGAVDVLTTGSDGAPVVTASDAPLRLMQLPRDIVSMRHAAPQRARAWRLALREVLVAAFAEGLEVVGVSRDSCYVVTHPGS
jgi:predicted GNAT superfamily acetyltransferase